MSNYIGRGLKNVNNKFLACFLVPIGTIAGYFVISHLAELFRRSAHKGASVAPADDGAKSPLDIDQNHYTRLTSNPENEDEHHASPRQWRLLVFPVLGTAALVFGFISWHNGTPPKESSSVMNMSQVEYIFEKDPSVPLEVTADFSYAKNVDPNAVMEYLFINTPHPERQSANRIAVVMTPMSTTAFIPVDHRGQIANALLARFGNSKSRRETEYGQYIGDFYIKSAVDINKGGLFMHLPTIGNFNSIYGWKTDIADIAGQADAMAEYRGSRPTDVLMSSLELLHGSPSNPWNYRGSSKDTGRDLMYIPHLMSIKEVFDGANLSDIPNYQVQSSQPSVNITNGQLTWTGNNVLTSYLTAIDPSSEETHANWIFVAGIALAAGASLIIATLQERRKIRRRPGAQSSE